ncbi:ATP-binding protein [Prosthecobacter sp.]|uniref:AAA family ATPase n=1 Tax=Prosthecobacter sp. TaxID=1965333 RepID=UPI002489AC8C|nr:ATP-binding protein [Prosthecobacter sp.]MDI1315375.1 AAA family ATPase [Prosthecobacter sp.]
MAHIKQISLTNLRSFGKAECRLSPFTLVVGANNSGKTNFLRAFADYAAASALDTAPPPHRNSPDQKALVELVTADGTPPDIRHPLPVYRFDPDAIGKPEAAAQSVPFVRENGEGVTQVIERLREEDSPAFAAIQSQFCSAISEIESISLTTLPTGGKKMIMLQERGLTEKTPLSDVSEGTRLVLALLTALHQKAPPPVILIEDLDRALHPRLYERLVGIIHRIVRDTGVQIIATSHNPYLIDYFQDQPEAVVLVEKKDGMSTLANLDDRLKAIDWDSPTVEEMPLGQMWFSGLVGGVPTLQRKPAA